jgi:hypothetical protein
LEVVVSVFGSVEVVMMWDKVDGLRLHDSMLALVLKVDRRSGSDYLDMADQQVGNVAAEDDHTAPVVVSVVVAAAAAVVVDNAADIDIVQVVAEILWDLWDFELPVVRPCECS